MAVPEAPQSGELPKPRSLPHPNAAASSEPRTSTTGLERQESAQAFGSLHGRRRSVLIASMKNVVNAVTADSRLRDHLSKKEEEQMKLAREARLHNRASIFFGKRNITLDTATLAEQSAEPLMPVGEEPLPCVLMPNGRVRACWDTISLLLIVYVSLFLPYRLAFLDGWLLGLEVTDLCIDAFFMADIVLSFFTACKIGDIVVTDHRAIACIYLRTWFLLDLVATLPFSWFVDGGGLALRAPSANTTHSAQEAQVIGIVRILKVIRLLRLLRVLKAVRLFGSWEAQLMKFLNNSNALRLIKVSMVVCLFVHWAACMQVYVGKQIDSDESIDFTSWVMRSPLHGVSPVQQWAWAIYHTFTQMLLISDGLASPATIQEMLTFLPCIAIGAVLYACFVASLTLVFSETGAASRAFRDHLNALNNYSDHIGLDEQMRLKLRAYYELKYPSGKSFNEEMLVAGLSEPLRVSLLLHKYDSVLKALNIMDHPSLSRALVRELLVMNFVHEDMVLWKDEPSKGMYFILSGLAQVLVPAIESTEHQHDVLTTLGRDSFFGEMALLEPDGVNSASVRVMGFCECVHLSAEAYTALLKRFPDFNKIMTVIATMRTNVGQHREDEIRSFRRTKAYSTAAGRTPSILAAHGDSTPRSLNRSSDPFNISELLALAKADCGGSASSGTVVSRVSFPAPAAPPSLYRPSAPASVAPNAGPSRGADHQLSSLEA